MSSDERRTGLAGYAAGDVLDCLDRASSKGPFFDPNTLSFNYVASRLTAFRSPKEWCITSEFIYAPHDLDVVAVPVNSVAGGTLRVCEWNSWADASGFVRGWIDLDGEVLLLGRERVHVSLAGIAKLEDDVSDWPRYEAALDAVIGRLREEILPRRELVYRSVGELAVLLGFEESDVLLVLDRWVPPNGGLPSTSPTFRSLAAALAANDASVYGVEDIEGYRNSDWQNWPVDEI